MSRSWTFYSYSQALFDNFFGGEVPDAARQLVAAVTWDEGAWPDPTLPEQLAERVARDGIAYAGLSPQESACLDRMLPLVFAPEGLAEILEVVPESPDGLHPSVVQELLPAAGRGQEGSLLRVLLDGRRYGDTEFFPCEYCFFSLAECEQLLSEVRSAAAAGGPWRQRDVPDVVEEWLVGPLQSALAKKRPLFGALG